MTEQTRPDEQPQFETDTVQANQAEQQGLGLGERELQAQREAGDTTAQADVDQDDDQIEEDVAVQGADEDDTERQAPEA